MMGKTSGQGSPRVAMVISRPYEPDVRAQKEAHSLALAGYKVQVIAWDRAGTQLPHAVETAPDTLLDELADWEERRTDTPLPVAITHIRVEAGFRTGRRLLRAMPRFWWRAWGELRRFRPDVVHAHDLDTLPLAYAYGRATGACVIYDAREYYPGMVRDSVGAQGSALLEWLDRWLTPRADAVVTVGERLAERLRAMGGRVWVVHNSQARAYAEPSAGLRAAIRREWGIPDEALVVIYVGYLNAERLIGPVVSAIGASCSAPDVGLSDVWLVVAGDGAQMDEIRAAAEGCERIKVLGWISLEDVASVVAASDVVYYGLNEQNANSTYFMPNLAFFALAAGRPLLTTPVGEVAEMVRREGCGLVLERVSAEAVREALEQLRRPGVYATLAGRARFLSQQKYRWRVAASALLAAYGECKQP